jgi:hypothetical protein
VSLWAELDLRAANREAILSGTGIQDFLCYMGTTGSGELRLKAPVIFDTPFSQRPILHVGVSLTDGGLLTGSFPHVTAGVAGWSVAANGDFVGAYLFVQVTSSKTSYALTHHYTFTGDVSRRGLAQILDASA